MNRLSFKLIAAFTTVVLIGAVITYVFAQQQLTRHFQSYLRGRDLVHAAALAPFFADYYQQYGTWEGIQTAIESDTASQDRLDNQTRQGRGPGSSRGRLAGYGMSGWEGDRILLLDTNNRIVYATESSRIGQAIDPSGAAAGTVVSVNNQEVGRLLVYSEPEGSLAAITDEFVSRLNRGVLLAAAVAGVVAIVLAALFVRQMVAPLHRLRTAANAITAGDLSQRVPAPARDELGDVGRAFNNMAQRLERDETMRRNMMADIAHELRTPLTVMQGQVEAILDGVFPMETEQLTPIHDQIVLLNRLVSDLRDQALADAGHLQLSLSPVDIVTLVHSAAAAVEPLAAEQSISIRVSREEDLPQVQGDTERLRQVLHNLLINSLRHTPTGGSIETAVEASSSAPDEMRYVTVSVTDTGSGIAAEDLPHIFDRFYRSPTARRKGMGGTGLGLTISRSIIEAHGGKISITSQEGAGTSVVFTLPVDRDATSYPIDR
jgi:signal transduction histidine kinase